MFTNKGCWDNKINPQRKYDIPHGRNMIYKNFLIKRVFVSLDVLFDLDQKNFRATHVETL